MNTLAAPSLHASLRPGAHAVPGRRPGPWMKRVAAVLWQGLQEARQARPERELLELIERCRATPSNPAVKSDSEHELRAARRRLAEPRTSITPGKEHSS